MSLAVIVSVASADTLRERFNLTEETFAGGFKAEITAEDGSVALATVRPERWRGDDMAGYTVRFPAGTLAVDVVVIKVTIPSRGQNQVDATTVILAKIKKIGGQFVTGLRGKIEKWDVDWDRDGNRDNEEPVLVFRTSDGKFVDWIPLGDKITTGWNFVRDDRLGRKWVFESRYKRGTPGMGGQFIVREFLVTAIGDLGSPDLKAFIQYPNDNTVCPRLTIRESSEGLNKGAFVTAVAGRVEGDKCVYRCPDSPFLKGEGLINQQLTSISIKNIQGDADLRTQEKVVQQQGR
jgi:hypothetical protein